MDSPQIDWSLVSLFWQMRLAIEQEKPTTYMPVLRDLRDWGLLHDRDVARLIPHEVIELWAANGDDYYTKLWEAIQAHQEAQEATQSDA